jgi:hypothetical protein
MKLKADSPEKHAWNEWRMVATTLLVRIGGKTEKEFLEMKLTGIKSEGHAKLTELVEEAIERLDR